MAKISKELYSKLLLADSQEEVTELLKANGREDVPAQEVWEKVQQRRTQDGVERSLEELEDVAGGRNWWTEGCAATVEPGSDCWGTDGGCYAINLDYEWMPNEKCPRCGSWACIVNHYDNQHKYRVLCRNCGEFGIY